MMCSCRLFKNQEPITVRDYGGWCGAETLRSGAIGSPLRPQSLQTAVLSPMTNEDYPASILKGRC
jgi:hypothetical protein